MVNYKCQRCGYETSHKSVFKKHLLRKYLCKPLMKEIERYDLLVLNGFDEESKIYEKIHKNTQNYQQKSKNNDDNICSHCNKILSCYRSKWTYY